MSIKKNIDSEILSIAQKALHYNDLLIKQCDSWLSAEEGNRNMEARIRERKKNQDFKIQ
jgi:tRNA U34 2-thiouridine synthase MnmA/TrmU